MKGVILLIVFSCAFATVCHGQTFDEWFRQKKTQRKYLVQQIAAYRLYAGYLAKGYKIAREGTGLISGITNGELALHEAFFKSLQVVNPKVRSYGKIADFIAVQSDILSTCKRVSRKARDADIFSPEGLHVLTSASDGIITEVALAIEDLVAVLADSSIQMPDAARMARIDLLYNDALVLQTASRQLCQDVSLAVNEREKRQTEIDATRVLYNIQK